ncbi:MAG: hypothetical protein AB8E15_02705 [Bdellovibrionales bacterium]
MKKIALVGHNLTNLVFALENQVTQNYEIDFYGFENFRAGHFSGLYDRSFPFPLDIGMVLFELETYKDCCSNITEYNEKTIGDSGRFTHKIEKWLVGKGLEFEESLPIKSVVKNEVYSDFFITNHFDYFIEKSFQEKYVKDFSRDPKNPSHPKNKSLWGKKESPSLRQVSERTLGNPFTKDFIQSYFNNFDRNIDIENVPASLHRSLWAPLLYPETIIDFIKTRDPKINPSRFHIVKNQNTAQSMTQLISKIDQNSTHINFAPQFNQKNADQYDFVVYGEKPKTEILDKIEKGSLRLIYLSIDDWEADFQCLNIFQSPSHIFRVSNVGKNKLTTYLCIEQPLHFECNEDDIIKELREIILGSKPIINVIKKIEAKNSLELPTYKNLMLHEEASRALTENFKNYILAGSNSELGNRSFNDQVALGLKLFEKLKDSDVYY